MATKTCKTCKTEFDISHFSKRKREYIELCKKCADKEIYKKEKKRMEKDPNYKEKREKAIIEVIQKQEQLGTKACKTCNKTKEISLFIKTNFGYRSQCKECYNKMRYKQRQEKLLADEELAKKEKEKRKQYINTEEFKKKQKKLTAEWYQKNKPAVRKYTNEYRKNNPLIRIKRSYQRRMNTCLKENRNHKLLGCDITLFKKWIQFNFDLDSELNMTLDNYGSKWHMDHVIPCDLYDFNKQSHMDQCFHWTNIRPLLAHDNISKNNNIDKNAIKQQNTRLELFCRQNKIDVRQITIPKEKQDHQIAGNP